MQIRLEITKWGGADIGKNGWNDQKLQNSSHEVNKSWNL